MGTADRLLTPDLRPRTAGVVAACVAAGLGLAHAAVSAYWALGGTALLGTIGGAIERWGRGRGPSVIGALWGIVVLKTMLAVAAPIVAIRPGWLPQWTAGRVPRILSWVAAVAMTLYGVLQTLGSLLAVTGAVNPGPDANRGALAWHAFFWDPWFVAWGGAFLISLWLARPFRIRMATRERGTTMESASRLDSGVTALVLGFFAMMWFSWGQADASSVLGTALAVGSVVALVVAAMGGIRAVRFRRTDGALNEPATRHRYGNVVGIESAAGVVGALVLGATGGGAYIPVWICAVVGLHFFPLASVLDARPLRSLGVVVTGVAAGALLVGVFTGVAPSSVTGAGAGLALLAFATLMLARPAPR
ncbi:MAG: hypothetical protein QOI99_1635 [Actinomycetota bacterium]|nr:hypothetical protein [Actinomycetota bacterium]